MRKRETNEGQMVLEALLDDGELHKLEISPDDIGGELLAILTKGLYTNSMDCIREYVQNAVDAGADNVKIKITGNSVFIRDDGRGMDLDDLLQARQFGLSYKLLDKHVGFRGIGIYSGFDLCRSLRLTTKKKDQDRQHVIVFEFHGMKLQLENDRKENTGAIKTSLLKLLSEHTYIKREQSNLPPEESFTLVELQDINDFHIKQLLDRQKLKTYLLRNLPVDFADTFQYKSEVNSHLLQNVPGYHPIKIDLESDGIEDEIVDKYVGLELQPPVYGTLTNGNNQIGYYWACMTAKNEMIERNVEQEDKKYAGFVYKVKGFTVGDRSNPAKVFAKRNQMYPWYTGEIYVLDPDIIPNAERNDFETSSAKQNLEISFRLEVDTKLRKAVLVFQAEERAKEILKRSQEEIANVNSWLNDTQVSQKSKSYESELDVYSDLDRIIDSLRKQKASLRGDERKQAEEILKNAKKTQEQLVKDVQSATPQSTRKKREAKKDSIPENLTDLGNSPAVVIPPPTLPLLPRTLQDILIDSAWSIEGEVRLLVNAIQSSIEEVLVPGSVTYRSLLDQIETKISNEDMNE